MDKVLVTVWKCEGLGENYTEVQHRFWFRKDYQPQTSLIQKILNVLTIGRV